MQRPSARISRKIFSRLPSLEPTQRSRKFLSLTIRHAGLAGETFHQKCFAGADRAAQQVTHGQRFEIAGLPQLDVLTQPAFQRFLAVISIERARGLDEFHQPAESRSTSSFLMRVRSAPVSAWPEWSRTFTRLSKAEIVTPTNAALICARFASGSKAFRLMRAQKRQRAFDLRRIWQRHANARGMRAERDQRLDIVEIVGDQNAGERQIGERRFGRPLAQHAGKTAVFEAGAIGRHDVVDAPRRMTATFSFTSRPIARKLPR